MFKWNVIKSGKQDHRRIVNETTKFFQKTIINNGVISLPHFPTLHSLCQYQFVQTWECTVFPLENLAFSFFALQLFTFLKSLIKTPYFSENVTLVYLQEMWRLLQCHFLTCRLSINAKLGNVICCHQELKTNNFVV